jgi:hypothetical protein
VILDDDFYGEELRDSDFGRGTGMKAAPSGLGSLEREIKGAVLGIEAQCNAMETAVESQREWMEKTSGGGSEGVAERLELVERMVAHDTCGPTLLTNPELLADLGSAEAGLWIAARDNIHRMVSLGKSAQEGTQRREYTIPAVRKLVSATGLEMTEMMVLLALSIPEGALGLMFDRVDYATVISVNR